MHEYENTTFENQMGTQLFKYLPLISVQFLESAEKEENDLLKVDVKQKDAYDEN